MSAHLEAHRETYHDRLLAVSRDDDWTGWCHFFLEAIRQQAEDSLARAQGILNLYGRHERSGHQPGPFPVRDSCSGLDLQTTHLQKHRLCEPGAHPGANIPTDPQVPT